MPLPLPRVVSDVGPGGPLVTAMRGMNALSSDMLDNKIKGIQTQYAPYTTYADAASKLAYANMLPYQVQATVMSNPMMWMALKDNPEALKAMMDNFQKSVPQGNNIFGNVSLPNPSESSNSLGSNLFNKLLNMIGLGDNAEQAPSQQMGQPSAGAGNVFSPNAAPAQTISRQNPNALVPATGGGLNAVLGSKIAPMQESPYKPGATFVDPQTGRVISAPSAKTVTSTQQQLLASKRVEPQLERIADEWSDFMDLKGHAKLTGARVGNFLKGVVPDSVVSALGDEKASDLPSKYAKAKATTETAPEALLKSYGLNPTNETISRMQSTIEPLWGETKESYKARIKQQLEEIRREQIAESEKSLAGGFDVTQTGSQDNQTQQEKPIDFDANIGKQFKNEIILPGGLSVPRSFPSKKAYQAWFNEQPKQTQLAYAQYLKDKERGK